MLSRLAFGLDATAFVKSLTVFRSILGAGDGRSGSSNNHSGSSAGSRSLIHSYCLPLIWRLGGATTCPATPRTSIFFRDLVAGSVLPHVLYPSGKTK